MKNKQTLTLSASKNIIWIVPNETDILDLNLKCTGHLEKFNFRLILEYLRHGLCSLGQTPRIWHTFSEQRKSSSEVAFSLLNRLKLCIFKGLKELYN